MDDNFRSFTNNQQMIAHMRKLAKENKTTTEVILEEYTLDDFVFSLFTMLIQDQFLILSLDL